MSIGLCGIGLCGMCGMLLGLETQKKNSFTFRDTPEICTPALRRRFKSSAPALGWSILCGGRAGTSEHKSRTRCPRSGALEVILDGNTFYSKAPTGDSLDFEVSHGIAKLRWSAALSDRRFIRRLTFPPRPVCLESDACLVVVTVFKTVAPTLCVGG
jgi:hypothetical protein